MGVWNISTLDNDTAADFIGHNCTGRRKDWRPILEALAEAVAPESERRAGYQKYELFEALAACEVVAWARGTGRDVGFVSNQEAIAKFIKRAPLPSALVVQLAQLVAQKSGACKDLEEWEEVFTDLQERLGGTVDSIEEYAREWAKLDALTPKGAIEVLLQSKREVRACVEINLQRLAVQSIKGDAKRRADAMICMVDIQRYRLEHPRESKEEIVAKPKRRSASTVAATATGTRKAG